MITTLSLIAALTAVQPLPMPAAPTPALPAPRDAAYPGTIALHVDATDTEQRIIAVHEVIPVAKSGDVVLLLPKWIPGEHGPAGDDTKIAGVHTLVDGHEIAWWRDPVATNGFHVTVPEGAKTLTVDFQYLSPVEDKDGVMVQTRVMADLQGWNLSLYPAGYFTRRIPIQLTLTLPKDWQAASALELDHRDGDALTYKPISYDNYVDSPVLAGRYFKRYDLDPGAKVPVFMDVVGDTAADAEVPAAYVAIQARAVQEAYKLFGARHYDHYDFLVAVSDEMGGIGLEHHRSSEDAVVRGYFSDTVGKGFGRNILTHEYIHSWDGKFRRPAGQFTADFQQPMRDGLLWMYEGGTEYWGFVTESRAGLYSFDQRLQMLASVAANYDGLPGRQWRSMADTTYDSILSDRGPKSWPSWQRSEDYYDEGALMWLDADTFIREKTGGKTSLDDFAKGFFGRYDQSYLPMTYTADDVAAALNAVYPYDWKTFLTTRLTHTGGNAPLDGLARGGYRLVYDDTQSDYLKSEDKRRGRVSFLTSIGLIAKPDGSVLQVMWDGPAFKLNMTAGDKILAVNGFAFDGDKLKTAIRNAHAPDNRDIIDLLVMSHGEARDVRFDYHDGLRYPHLERIEGTPDLLKQIFDPSH